jgi:RHS repeat-associated protein
MRTNNTRIFDFDDENQLIRITEPGAWKSEFYYDGLMRRRIRKEYTWQSSAWVQTNEMHYVYDGMLAIQERDANNLPQVTYTRGDDLSGSLQGAGGIGGLPARTSTPQLLSVDPNTHAYYHCDGNGNVTALVSTNGFVQAKYEYDPYGNIIAISGSLAEANTYRFSSKEWHLNSGLNYYGLRFYSPSLQRWINRDPIQGWGGVNLYELADNNVLNLTDPLGLCPGDPYPSGDAAATAALQGINQESILENREYNGWIYKNKDGSFTYGAPSRGWVDASFPPLTGFFDPSAIYNYHTHGANDPNYKSEDFSGSDRRNNRRRHGGYLGTPSGAIKFDDGIMPHSRILPATTGTPGWPGFTAPIPMSGVRENNIVMPPALRPPC